MRRRQFIIMLGGATALSPFAARAQQSGLARRVGVFANATTPVMRPAYRALLDELSKLGFTEGQNLTIDLQSTEQSPAALARNVAEMVAAKVDVIVAGTEPALQAAAATGLPVIVCAINFDPIAHGYVKSLARPGGNVTGVVLRQIELAEKQVELLTQAFPDRKRLALLWDAISADQFVAAERRAKALGLDVLSLKFANPPYEFSVAFQQMVAAGTQMVHSLSSPFFGPHGQVIADMATQHRLPTMFIFRRYVELGGLMSYGADIKAIYSQAASYVAKALRGTRPADLPVEQPNTFEFAVNLRTAKAIGIELPTSILLRANEVIE